MTQKLPLRTAFKLKGIVKTLDEEIVKYEEVRKSALDKYGSKKEDGSLQTDALGNVKFEGDSIKVFMKEINDLTSIDIPTPTVSLNDLGNELDITPGDLMILDELITE